MPRELLSRILLVAVIVKSALEILIAITKMRS